MSEIEELIKAYDGQIRLPWKSYISGAEKVWFLVYNQSNERRIRFRLPDFETTTKKAGYKWIAVDLTDDFAAWMANHRYRESYFDSPDLITPALKDFTEVIVKKVTDVLEGPDVDEHTVVAVTGVASLFGLTRVSTVLERITRTIRGRILVFFPGSHEGSNYRLLDARDGSNYLAIPIKAQEGKE